jgi:predicted branched-subunit amino acid permease
MKKRRTVYSDTAMVRHAQLKTFTAAFKYSIPVLLGFFAIGIAYGLLLVDAGYPWWLAPVMSVVIYAGSGQFLAVGLFAAGAGLWESVLAQLILNVRHVAYGLSLFKRLNAAKPFKWYLIYALSDETFALLSSLPAEHPAQLPSEHPTKFPAEPSADEADPAHKERNLLMFFIALLDESYWVAGSIIGAVAGTLIPFNMEGIGFALTALFIVLMVEQMFRVKRPLPFVIAALAAVLAVIFLPARFTIIAALAVAIILAQGTNGSPISGSPPGNRGGIDA